MSFRGSFVTDLTGWCGIRKCVLLHLAFPSEPGEGAVGVSMTAGCFIAAVRASSGLGFPFAVGTGHQLRSYIHYWKQSLEIAQLIR